MVLSHDEGFQKIKVCAIDDLPQDGICAVTETQRQHEAQLSKLHAQMKDRLVMPEVWKDLFPDAPILISSAISGGDLPERFQEAVKERICYLFLDPMRVSFPFPYPDGIGTAVEQVPGEGFYSSSLCCYYAHFAGNDPHVILWDTDSTMEEKKRLAKEAGFFGFAEK